MKNDKNDNKDHNNPASQKQNVGNRQNTGDSNREKLPSSKKKNDEEENKINRGGDKKVLNPEEKFR